MAIFSGTVFSSKIEQQTKIEVIMPQADFENRKVLYLLHGLSDDSSMWTRQTRIEPYAVARNYVVVMPEVYRSFYTDMKYGGQFFSYITDELPVICENLLGIKPCREKTFVAGLSMGGFGAMKCGLRRPDLYKGCASFSGALDGLSILNGESMDFYREKFAIRGEIGKCGEGDDLFALAENVNELDIDKKPDVFVTCGNRDFLIESNRAFDKHMKTQNFNYKYMEWDGEHTWDFWDKSIQLAFDFFDK